MCHTVKHKEGWDIMTQQAKTKVPPMSASAIRALEMKQRIQECQAAEFALREPLTWFDIINLQSAQSRQQREVRHA